MTALWTAYDAALATGAPLVSGAGWEAAGVSIDTRSLAASDLYIALKGPRFDGHDYVGAAFSGGASAAMVDRAIPGIDPTRLLAVPNTQAGLEGLAHAARARSKARIAAVTGSVGKTGTKEALARLLAGQGQTHASSGNLNNQIGMPLSLARMPESAAFGVFELGMNHAGEICPLSQMLRPHVAIITTVEPVHIEYFDSIEGIADAKAEIFAGMDREGVAILNRDNGQFARLAESAKKAGIGRIWTFGEAQEADARLASVSLTAEGSLAEATIMGRKVRFRLGLPGRHHVQNSLAVLLAVVALGGDLDGACTALADLTPVKGRGVSSDVPFAGGYIRLIDESYNASPAAVRAALQVLAMMRPGVGGKKIVALGDMLELGVSGPSEHAALADDLIASGVDLVFTAGPLMRHLYDALPLGLRGGHAGDATALAQQIMAAAKAGDVVLIKGSAGSRMGAVVTAFHQAEKNGMRHAV
jgi:UDP-N-acetylmuramoyl-tripeptide--D-alanyl-D-alanine ligase